MDSPNSCKKPGDKVCCKPAADKNKNGTIQPCISDPQSGGCQLSQGKCCKPASQVIESVVVESDCADEGCCGGAAPTTDAQNVESCTRGCCDDDGEEDAESAFSEIDCDKGCCDGNDEEGILAAVADKDDGCSECCEPAPSESDCEEDCCDKPKEAPAKVQEICGKVCCDTPVESDLEDDCDKGCCNEPTFGKVSIKVSPEADEDCCKASTTSSVADVTTPDNCNKGCCDAPKDSGEEDQKNGVIDNDDCNKGCCDSPLDSELEDDCKKGCCEKPASKEASIKAPSTKDDCKIGCCAPKPVLQDTFQDRCNASIASSVAKSCSSGTSRKERSGTLRHRIAKKCPKDGPIAPGRQEAPRPSTALSKALASVKRLAQYTCCCGTTTIPTLEPEFKPRRLQPAPIIVRAPKQKPTVAALSEDFAEKGAGGERRKIVMSVQGMECPGCCPRVTSALLSTPSVTLPKVNFFTGEATFLYTVGGMMPEDIARRASTLTSFTCRVIRDTQEKEVVHTMSVSVDEGWLNVKLPKGVSILGQKKMKRNAMRISLEVQHGTEIQPRDVLGLFASVGGEFEKTTQTGRDNATNEFHRLLLRTAMSSVATIPVLIFAWAPVPEHEVAYQSTSLALATFVQGYIAAPIYSASLRALFLQRTIDMDLLVVLSTTVAYVYSVVTFGLMVSGKPFQEGFFETSTLLVTLIMVGRLLSAYARRKATSALDSLDAMQADTVKLVQQPSGDVVELPGELLHVGDVLRIFPDSIIPTDGLVCSGTSEVDESTVTGESLPVDKSKGSELIAGTVNLSGALEMTVTRIFADNTISNISQLMREAQDSRLPVQDLADKVAEYFAPVVLVIAAGVFTAWAFGGVYAQEKTAKDALIAALKYTIAVLVVSCPCAIALCVPMVVVIAVSVGAKQGVLFKTIGSVQYARKTKVVMFDKTGTLTEGALSVVASSLYTSDAPVLALALVLASNHPVAKSVAEYLQQTASKDPKLAIADVVSVAGKGLESSFRGKTLRGGNCTWLAVDDHPDVVSLRGQSRTIFAVTLDGQLVALFGLVDSVRPNALEMVDWLRSQSIDAYIVSGDEQSVVSALAEHLGVPSERAFGRCSPEDKAALVKKVQESPLNNGEGVMFVGDGTNDSLALTQAHTGVSISSGTDVALGAADVVLVKPTNIARSMRAVLVLSDAAYKRIVGNFAWSFLYNVVAVLLAGGAFAAGGLEKVVIPPAFAGLGELVSIMPVILIAWSMRYIRV